MYELHCMSSFSCWFRDTSCPVQKDNLYESTDREVKKIGRRMRFKGEFKDPLLTNKCYKFI